MSFILADVGHLRVQEKLMGTEDDQPFWDQSLIEQTALTPVWGTRKELNEGFRIILQRAAATREAPPCPSWKYLGLKSFLSLSVNQ